MKAIFSLLMANAFGYSQFSDLAVTDDGEQSYGNTQTSGDGEAVAHIRELRQA
jgi:hypothetical protein